MKQPTSEAVSAIIAVIQRGSPTEGSNDKWREHSPGHHIRKALGHLIKWEEEIGGKLPDGENHITHALTRLAMALSLTHDG